MTLSRVECPSKHAFGILFSLPVINEAYRRQSIELCELIQPFKDIRIQLPCGCVRHYDTLDDIPMQDVLCDCPAQNHFIKYVSIRKRL